MTTVRRSLVETLVHLVTDWWPRVSLLEDEHAIVPGLRTWHSGVHHRSSLVVEVDTAVGTVAISDSFFVYENVETDLAPLGLNESFEEMFTDQRPGATYGAAHRAPVRPPRLRPLPRRRHRALASRG